jgi:tripartite-type tricarboxylate transporter receptor subunit TctC
MDKTPILRMLFATIDFVSYRAISIHLFLIAALTCVIFHTCWAQNSNIWPDKPVRIYSTSPPGGTIDLLSRMVAQECSKNLGKSFVVENKPGANGNLAAESVVSSPPDGYLWFVTLPGVFSINRFLFKRIPFDTDKDILPVAMLGESPLIFLVPTSSPVQNFPELIKWVRANPGKFSYSSAGVGTTGHLGMELLKQMANLDIVHIPYKGTAAATNDLLSGQVQMTMDNTTSAMPHIRSGMLRGLAVGDKQRISVAPDLPTIGESGVPGYSVEPWFGLGTRTGVPPDIVNKVHSCATAAITQADNVKRLTNSGITPRPMTEAAFISYAKSETEKWGEIVRKSGANLD